MTLHYSHHFPSLQTCSHFSRFENESVRSENIPPSSVLHSSLCFDIFSLLFISVGLPMTVSCQNYPKAYSSQPQDFFLLFWSLFSYVILTHQLDYLFVMLNWCPGPWHVHKSISCSVLKVLKSTSSKTYKIIPLSWAHSRIQNDVWLIRRLLMSAKASVKLNRGLRYHESEWSKNFVGCGLSLLFSLLVLLYFCFFSALICAAMFRKSDGLRLRPRFICGLWRGLVMLYKRNTDSVNKDTQ